MAIAGLCRQLRDDAAFILTFYLGRLGLQASLLSASLTTELSCPTGSAAGAPAVPALVLQLPAAACTGGLRSSVSMPATPQADAALAAAAADLRPQAATFGRSSITSALMSGASSTAVTAAVLQETAVSTQAGQVASDDVAAVVGTSSVRRPARQRQRYVHVAGSAVFSPGAMAALQHVRSLQAAATSLDKQRATGNTAAGSYDSSGIAALAAASKPTGVRLSSRPSSIDLVASARSNSVCLAQSGSESVTAPAAGKVTAVSYAGGRCDSECYNGAATAAERYWAEPSHSNSTTAAALSPLLSSLFTGELQGSKVSNGMAVMPVHSSSLLLCVHTYYDTEHVVQGAAREQCFGNV